MFSHHLWEIIGISEKCLYDKDSPTTATTCSTTTCAKSNGSAKSNSSAKSKASPSTKRNYSWATKGTGWNQKEKDPFYKTAASPPYQTKENPTPVRNYQTG